MPDLCPCCNGPLLGQALKWMPEARILVWDGSAARLSKNETLLFDALWRARRTGRVLEARQLGEIVWGDNPNGGPESLKGIGVLAYDIRIKTNGCGLTVAGDSGSTGGYRLAAATRS